MWYRNYRYKNWTMFKDYENNIQYGISECKEWIEPETIEYPKSESEYLASEEEVEKALRKEAKRRGFVKGTKFLGCEGFQKDELLIIDEIIFMNFSSNCGLYNEDSWIFRNGEWGTVVEEQKEEFNVLNRIIGVASNNFFDSLDSKTAQAEVGELYFFHNSEKHGANFYELVKEVETKVNDGETSLWKTFVIYKQLGSGLEFSREKEEFLSKFKQVHV